MNKKALLALAVIIALPALAAAWWLLSPLFLNTTVEEEFPYSANAEIPAGVTQEQAEMAMSTMAMVNMEEMEKMPPEMAEAVALSSGEFRDGDSFHKGSGTATLYRLENGDAVLRFEDLDVTNGPDLRVLLTPHPDPPGKAELDEAGYLHVAKLKGNRGDQNYPLPADVDPESFGAVVIYCMPFHVVFSVAPLR